MDWTEMARAWVDQETIMEAAFRPVLDALLAEANLQLGERVLDIGFGTGDSVMAALDATGPRGSVAGLDIAPDMVTRAVERSRGQADLRTGNAQKKVFEPDSFDAVISKFGMMFFDDPQAAFANIHKAMASSGRMCFAAWASRRENPWFRIPARVAQARLGPAEPVPMHAPGPFGFEDADRVIGLMQAAGWHDARVTTHQLDLTPPGTAAEFAATQMKIGPAAQLAVASNASAQDTEALHADLTDAFSAMETGAGIRIPALIHVFRANASG